MEALKLAFDAIIVGALALPWITMGLFLTLGSRNGQLRQVMTTLSVQVPPAVAGVVLFAIAYLLGAAVSRVSEDFFNDDDLRLPFTESGIRASVYCNDSERQFASLPVEIAVKDDEGHQFRMSPPSFAEQFAERCDRFVAKKPTDLIFHLQESALLMQPGDRLERLDQRHAQISVLRGAAFNGLITCAFCLFGLCATERAKRVKWVLPTVLVLFGVVSLGVHVATHHNLDDPPFMEFAFIMLGLAAGSVASKGAPKAPYVSYLLVSAVLTVIAYFGWWWSEVLYDRQVLYSFYANTHSLLTLVRPGVP